MRKVEIPLVYDLSGNWLVVCGLTYDDEDSIIEVDAWDGDGVINYKKGEFSIDE